MEQNEFYLKSLELIESRNKSRLAENSNTPLENETESLFIWMLSQFHLKMESTYPAAKAYRIEFNGTSSEHSPGLRYGYISDYYLHYIEFYEDFIEVIKNVIKIFKQNKNFDVPICKIPEKYTKIKELYIVLEFSSES